MRSTGVVMMGIGRDGKLGGDRIKTLRANSGRVSQDHTGTLYFSRRVFVAVCE